MDAWTAHACLEGRAACLNAHVRTVHVVTHPDSCNDPGSCGNGGATPGSEHLPMGAECSLPVRFPVTVYADSR